MSAKRVVWCLVTIGIGVSWPAAAAGQAVQPPQGAVAGAGGALRPGDAIRLKIWQEPGLSGDFVVDETGVAVLPRLGPTRVLDRPALQLKAELAEAYRRDLNHSSVEVMLLRRVQVLGAVRNPGLYEADPTMSVRDVLALAGGATSQGNVNGIQLNRAGRRLPGRLSEHALLESVAVDSGDEIYVPERGWISRNPYIVGALLSATVTLATRLLLR
jgi:polysaccharide export outer membrane protein